MAVSAACYGGRSGGGGQAAAVTPAWFGSESRAGPRGTPARWSHDCTHKHKRLAPAGTREKERRKKLLKEQKKQFPTKEFSIESDCIQYMD